MSGFALLVKLDQLDSREITSLDQLRLAAALLEAGDRRGYEQWRQSMAGRLTPPETSLPNSLIKACLLLPAGSNLLQSLVAASEADTTRQASAVGIHSPGRHRMTSSDAMVLLDYRCGDFTSVTPEHPMGIPPRLATINLIRAMELWQLKDYWGAMVEWTKGYALIQAGAGQGLVTLTAQSEIFPGISEPDYLQAAWYDWAVAGLLVGEWDEMLGEAERSLSRVAVGLPNLQQIALVRAVGEWHALRGEWSDALRCSKYCVKSNQGDSLDHATMDYQDAAIASRERADKSGYLLLREEMASRFKDPDKTTAARALTVGLMEPLDDRTAASLEPFAALLASGNEPDSYPLLGLLDYRRGYYAKAVERAHRSLSNLAGVAQPNAMDHVVLSMSLNQLGRSSAAALELEHVKNLVKTGFNLEYDIWHWRDWVLVRLLIQEADSLIPQAPSPQPSAALR